MRVEGGMKGTPCEVSIEVENPDKLDETVGYVDLKQCKSIHGKMLHGLGQGSMRLGST